MTTIDVDFNARTADDRIRLSTLGSQRSVDETGVEAGDWVWLTDGEVRAGGQLQDGGSEGLVARVAWETTEHILDDADLCGTQKALSAHAELKALMGRLDRDHRRVLALLPLVERRLPPGTGDYMRSRVAQAFGYPELALLAIDDALAKGPDDPSFTRQRLHILESLDLERAFSEARTLVDADGAPAIVLAACATIYAAYARQSAASGPQIRRELLRFTERFDQAPGRETLPVSVPAMICVNRGFALLALGNREQGVAELSKAIGFDPSSAEAYTARGIEHYPTPQALRDLENAIRLGAASVWPSYYLAHHRMQERDWSAAEKQCDDALMLDPPAPVRANLLEWRAIARFQQGAEIQSTRADFEHSLRLAPDNERLRRNLALLDRLEKTSAETPWRVERDVTGNATDAAAAA
jgi:tetratricopeptide (TPR) repeat protein